MKKKALVSLAFVLFASLLTTTWASDDEHSFPAGHRFVPISTCSTISQPGSYLVTNNIAATLGNVQTSSDTQQQACILITTNFVTIDLGGHTLLGPTGGILNGSGVEGIYSWRNRGIEVHSGVITQFRDGVALEGSGETVEQVRALDNTNIGIDVGLFGTGGHRVVANTVMNSFDGIAVESCPAVVRGNVATGNTFLQIYAQSAACTLSENSPLP